MKKSSMLDTKIQELSNKSIAQNFKNCFGEMTLDEYAKFLENHPHKITTQESHFYHFLLADQWKLQKPKEPASMPTQNIEP